MKITIYTTNTCAYCAMVKKYLAQKAPEGTLFEIVNLDDQPERRQEAVDVSGAFTVPVTVVDKFPWLGVVRTEPIHVVVGWKPAELAKALR